MQSIFERARTGGARWRILVVLEAGRPTNVNEDLIRICLDEANVPVSPQEVRRELDYLRDSGLVELHGEDSEYWSAALTAKGLEVVEYRVPNPPGVDRPRRRDLPTRR